MSEMVDFVGYRMLHIGCKEQNCNDLFNQGCGTVGAEEHCFAVRFFFMVFAQCCILFLLGFCSWKWEF